MTSGSKGQAMMTTTTKNNNSRRRRDRRRKNRRKKSENLGSCPTEPPTPPVVNWTLLPDELWQMIITGNTPPLELEDVLSCNLTSWLHPIGRIARTMIHNSVPVVQRHIQTMAEAIRSPEDVLRIYQIDPKGLAEAIVASSKLRNRTPVLGETAFFQRIVSAIASALCNEMKLTVVASASFDIVQITLKSNYGHAYMRRLVCVPILHLGRVGISAERLVFERGGDSSWEQVQYKDLSPQFLTIVEAVKTFLLCLNLKLYTWFPEIDKDSKHDTSLV